MFDPWHYVPVLARKPGALRNGAPFKDWLLPSAMERIRRKLAGSAAWCLIYAVDPVTPCSWDWPPHFSGPRQEGTMEPMKPMAPMKPMEPMKPMSGGEMWWPADLGQPSTSGSQNAMRYAFFPEKRRLLIEQDGKLTTYDSGDHRISGVSQQQSHGHSLAFTSQNGSVNLDELKKIG